MVIDQTNIYEQYKGLWVVLDQSRTGVLSAGKTLREALKQYHQHYGSDTAPIVFKVPSKLLAYVGYGQ